MKRNNNSPAETYTLKHLPSEIQEVSSIQEEEPRTSLN